MTEAGEWQATQRPRPYAPAINAGAGAITRAALGPEQADMYRAGLSAALAAGESVLQGGGAALDAVVEAVCILEDDPRFNAGCGSVLNHEGRVEMDAAVMDGRDRTAGAVGAVQRVRNPVRAARTVLARSPHVMLAGEGADAFAAAAGLAQAPAAYFETTRRRRQLDWARAAGGDIQPDHTLGSLGTVGAVACDAHGDLAAATSTGGMTNKRRGRIGDSPLIGAGTYASNASAAISGTGDGEWFIRATVARDIGARMEYGGERLASAAHAMVHDVLAPAGGDGGVIAVDRTARVAVEFNTAGMFRAWVHAGEPATVALFDR